MTLKELCDNTERLIDETRRPMTAYEAVGTLTEPMTDEELAVFLKTECNAGESIRYYLTEQAIRAVINELKYRRIRQ